jgi:hypothetical protein
MASAAARHVEVLFPVEPNYELMSFRLGDFGFGIFNFSVPPNTAYYTQRLDVRDSLGIFVDVIAGLDVTRNLAFWIFESIDPATGLPVTDPDLGGFLPVNDTVTHNGEGYVNYTIRPKSTLVTGDSVRAYGKITFDVNEPILTNTWQNKIDALPPESNPVVFPVYSQNQFPISFTGEDDPGGTGIESYYLYFAENNGPYNYFGIYPEGGQATFTGNYNTIYHFFSLGVDHTGNIEPMKSAPDATVVIDTSGLYNYVVMNLPAGWSGISSYVIPGDPSVVTMFEPVVNKMVILMDQVNIYWPAMGVNTIGNWNTHNGYIIKMNTASQLILSGLVETDREIQMAAGWNLVPVLSPNNVSTVDLFAPIGDTLTIVKEVAGNRIYWPSMGINMLPVLEPGRSYQVSVKNPTSITYPLSLTLVQVKPYNLVNETPWNDPIQTGQSHNFAIYKKVLKKLEKGDFIGAFNHEGLCVGLTKVEDAKANLALTVFGDDIFSTSFQDGMNPNEEIGFKAYRPASGMEIQLEVVFDGSLPDQGRFVIDGLSAMADILLSSVDIPGDMATGSIMIYPVPVEDQLTLVLDFQTLADCSMKLIDMQGNLVLEDEIKEPTRRIDVSMLPTGTYLLRLVNNGSIYIRKVVVM